MQRPTIVATNDTIRQIVKEEIEKYENAADLNHIDVSNVTDLSFVFRYLPFAGDISRWDVSNVIDMVGMFEGSSFNGNLSTWLLHADCDIGGMMYRTKNPIIPPLLRVDSIDDYQHKLETMFGKKMAYKKIPKNTSQVNAHHGVLLLVVPDQPHNTIHPQLTAADREKIQMLYQLTGSVYQSVKAWEQQHNNSMHAQQYCLYTPQ